MPPAAAEPTIEWRPGNSHMLPQFANGIWWVRAWTWELREPGI